MQTSRACRRRGSSAGLTLVELIVVFTIIGMLTALMFPVFAIARKRGLQTTCLSNMRQIGAAAQLYMSDNDGLLPKNPYRWPGYPRAKGMETTFRPSSALEKYGAGWNISHCPAVANFSDYEWRFELNVEHGNERMLQESSFRRIRPEPLSVLAYCYHHLKFDFDTSPHNDGHGSMVSQSYTYDSSKRHGSYVVLRADGSASFVPAEQVVVWDHGWHDGKDIWYPPNGTDEEKYMDGNYDVFPDEPWPPQFEEKK